MQNNDNPLLIEVLNRMLAKEHACAIRYATHAAMVVGPYVDPVSARFQEIASDEIAHAGKLRERICALGARRPWRSTAASARRPSRSAK